MSGNTAGAAARLAAACAKKEPETHPENIVLVDDGLDCDGDALRDMIKDMAAAEDQGCRQGENLGIPTTGAAKPLGEVRVVGGANVRASSAAAPRRAPRPRPRDRRGLEKPAGNGPAGGEATGRQSVDG